MADESINPELPDPDAALEKLLSNTVDADALLSGEVPNIEIVLTPMDLNDSTDLLGLNAEAIEALTDSTKLSTLGLEGFGNALSAEAAETLVDITKLSTLGLEGVGHLPLVQFENAKSDDDDDSSSLTDLAASLEEERAEFDRKVEASPIRRFFSRRAF